MVLTPMDWLTIALTVIFGVMGFIRGFIKEALSILSHIVAIVLAFRFHPQVFNAIKGFIPKGYLVAGKLVAFLAIYVGVIILFAILELLLKTIISFFYLRFFDRVLGLAFGALKGLLAATVVFIAIVTFAPSTEKYLSRGVTYPVLKMSSKVVIQLSPKKFKDKFLNRNILQRFGVMPWSGNQQ